MQVAQIVPTSVKKGKKKIFNLVSFFSECNDKRSEGKNKLAYQSHSKKGQLEISFLNKHDKRKTKKNLQIFFPVMFLTFKFLIPKIALKNSKKYLHMSKTKFSRLKLSLNKLL